MVTKPFASLARATARSLGMEALPILEVPWPFEATDAEEVVKNAVPLISKAPQASA